VIRRQISRQKLQAERPGTEKGPERLPCDRLQKEDVPWKEEWSLRAQLQ
jgi:hypothetical protein